MRLLLDTHILMALLDGTEEKLPSRQLSILRAPGAILSCSVASLWEIAIKHRLGKLPLRRQLEGLPSAIAEMGLDLLPILAPHVLAELNPEPPTRDPFDRLLLAQCQVEDMRLVTIDRALVDHPLAATGGS